MQQIAALILITLPWLHPFALGPTTSVVPLLVSWACAAALLFTGRPAQAPGSLLTLLGGLILLVVAVGLWPVGAMPGAEVLALAMGLLAVLACALLWLARSEPWFSRPARVAVPGSHWGKVLTRTPSAAA